MTDLSIHIATVNGSGSQSANQILVRSLFEMGWPVSGKNLFPSNIAGLPTWFTVRVSERGQLSRRASHNILVSLNPATLGGDLLALEPTGILIVSEDSKVEPPEGSRAFRVPFRKLVEPLNDSMKMKKLLHNLIYVGVLAEILNLDAKIVEKAVEIQFFGKNSLIQINQRAVDEGRRWARSQNLVSGFRLNPRPKPKGKILLDGNTAAALGAHAAGCHFLSWYPITPSTSLAESFQEIGDRFRKTRDGKKTFSVLQAEDELSAISMVLGASWAGARAMTCTSGPGLSLMAEAAGLSYFAEIPAVIWDVQRAGPSTGLPTRTQQSDILSAHFLSHGDTRHVVLLPGDPLECFQMAQMAFDLAERLQTLVNVLSDLDLGMNQWVTDDFTHLIGPWDRGKIQKQGEISEETYARYRDLHGDGICPRTLPGQKKGAYFTRGSGHDENSRYTEDPTAYKQLLDRLNRKWETSKSLMPEPEILGPPKAPLRLAAFGSSTLAAKDAQALLKDSGIESQLMLIKSLPFHPKSEKFFAEAEKIFVVEQNRDGQMAQIIKSLGTAGRVLSINQYDGLPLSGEWVFQEISHRLERTDEH